MSTPSPVADRNLIFGLLALQMDFVSREQLLDAMNAWMLRKDTSLAQLLRERGVLAERRAGVLDALVEEHLVRHGGDSQASLAALRVESAVRHDLGRLGDPDVQASVASIPSPPTRNDLAEDSVASLPTTAPVSGPTNARFRRLREHAKGGLGEVFVAQDEELRREVALKEIQDRFADHPEARERFVREAEVTGALEHPGVVPVYSLGVYPDGRPYYAMRFIKGDSLHDAVADFHAVERQGRPAAERSLQLRQLLGRFVDVCNAVAYAHSRGVIHRDLKPGNVMLGKYGETLVVDWGLAKVVGKAEVETTEAALVSSGDSTLTQAGQALGTPAYMSPEQAAGRLDLLGPASDVYSLGATLYCLLTGKPPVTKGEMGVVLARVQKGDFPPPRQVDPNVPPALEAVCLKAMALKPEDRYTSPRDLAEEVERWLADEPVRAYREPWRVRAGRWARRRPALVAGTTALLFTAVVAVAVGGLLVGREQQAKLEQQRKAREAQVRTLLEVAPQAVPAILEALEEYRDEIRPILRRETEKIEPENATDDVLRSWRQHRARAALALLTEDPEQLAPLNARLLEKGLDPAEMLLIRDALKPHAAELKDDLWRQAGAADAADRFRALVALAAYDPVSPRWKKAAAEAMAGMLADRLHVKSWVDALRPVRKSLRPPLAREFRDSTEYRQAAAQVLADYAADDPDQHELLADLLLDADAQQYTVLLPVLMRQPEQAAARMRQELVRLPDHWKDGPLDPAWKAPVDELLREVEQAGGIMAGRWALCQALPMARLQAVTEELRPAGYRPVRVRPWNPSPPAPLPEAERGEQGNRRLPAPPLRFGEGVGGRGCFVSVVWTRDGGDWKLATGLTAPQAKTSPAGMIPADVAAYPTKEGDRYVVLWRKPGKGEQAALYAGVPESDHKAATDAHKDDGYIPATLQALAGADGRVRYSGVWGKGPGKPEKWNLRWTDAEAAHDDLVFAGEQLLLDVHLGPAAPPRPLREKLQADLDKAQMDAEKEPKAANPHYFQGVALLHLGRDKEALAAFDAYFKASKAFFGHRYRTVLHARAGRAAEARRDLAAFAKVSTDRAVVQATTALVEVYLGNAPNALKTLDEAVAATPRDADTAYQAAGVYSLAAEIATVRQVAWAAGLVGAPGSLAALALPPHTAKPAHVERAVELLRLAIQRGHRDLAALQSDANLEAVRGSMGYRELLRQAGAQRHYASLWRDDTTREAVGLYRLSAEAHLARCRELAAQGYRPAALSLALLAGEKSPLAASVWHRPVQPAEQERLARRQATAAATLLHLKQPDPVWPLLRHSPDPTARSYLVERVGSRGVDPHVLAERLEVEKDVSARRALIMALGDYTDGNLPAAVRGPLVKKLLTWYRSDADAGIHGAIDWLLRHAKEGPLKRPLDWGQGKELERIDRELAGKPPLAPPLRFGLTLTHARSAFIDASGRLEERNFKTPVYAL